MKNNKGQALVEFVLILPVILLVLIYIIEFGRIVQRKQQLESDLDLVVTLYQEKKQQELNTYTQNNNITVTYNKQNELTTIEVSQDIKSNMPLVNSIIGNTIKTKRTIYEKAEQ